MNELVAYIESQITEDVDVSLTELCFNLQLTIKEQEDQIAKAKQSIVESKSQIIENQIRLQKEVQELQVLSQEYLTATSHKDDDKIYEKIEECVLYKNNIQQSIEMFEIVMSLASINELYQRFIDEEQDEELFHHINQNIAIYRLLLQLPKMNPRYGQMETIINTLQGYCFKDLFASTNYSIKFQILDLFKIQATDCYKQQRLAKIKITFEGDAIHQMIILTEGELQYLKQLKHFQHLFAEYISFILFEFQKQIFSTYFQNITQDKLYEYLTYFNILNNYFEKGYLTQQQLKQCIKVGFEPYSANVKQVQKNEQAFFSKLISKGKSINERISVNFDCQEILEQSLKRTLDLSFTLNTEDWSFECIKTYDQIIANVSQALKEIQMDDLGQVIKNIFANAPTQIQPKTKFLLKNNLSLFEILILKHYEIQQFRVLLECLDESIKNSFREMRDDLHKQVYNILCEKLQVGRRVYQEELSISSSLKVQLKDLQYEITILILRLLLSESLDQEDQLHTFRTLLDLIENTFKTIKPANKLNYKQCVALAPRLSYEDLEQKAKNNNHFSQHTCFWAALYIIVQNNIIKTPQLRALYDRFVPMELLD